MTSPEAWAQFWYRWTAASFLRAYLDKANTSNFLPNDKTELQTLLRAYMLEKALYELSYELNNRPDWVQIPLQSIQELLDDKAT